jgi:hypothetical protein
VSDANALGRFMRRIQCEGGETQIGRILEHAARSIGFALWPVKSVVAKFLL